MEEKQIILKQRKEEKSVRVTALGIANTTTWNTTGILTTRHSKTPALEYQ